MGAHHRSLRGVLQTIQSLLQVAPWTLLLRRVRPDAIVVGTTITPAPLLAAVFTGTPRAVILGESIRTNPTLCSLLPTSFIVRAVDAWSHVSVAVSEYAALQYRRPSIIEFPPVNVPATVAPKRHAPPEVLAAVLLGTLSTEKGQFDLVSTARHLLVTGTPVQIDLYGDAHPDDLARLNRMIRDTGVSSVLRHRGQTSDPLGILAGADVSLVCSRNEAYGRVTIESILVGTPVIGYDLGGTREILQSGGGVLVDPEPMAVADTLRNLASDPRALEALRSDAIQRSSKRTGVGDASRQWLRIRELLVQRLD